MANRPQDITDLHLAPVALALDARIDELAELSLEELGYTVALQADRPTSSREMRETGLLATVTYLVDCHGWSVSWDPRGICMEHHAHRLVLGVPELFTEFLAKGDSLASAEAPVDPAPDQG